MGSVVRALTGVITSILGGLKSSLGSVFIYLNPGVLAYKFLWFCVVSALFISIFLFGGIVTPFIGIFYVYFLLFKRIKCFYNRDKLPQHPDCV